LSCVGRGLCDGATDDVDDDTDGDNDDDKKYVTCINCDYPHYVITYHELPNYVIYLEFKFIFNKKVFKCKATTKARGENPVVRGRCIPFD
jgi:hypothetical protein